MGDKISDRAVWPRNIKSDFRAPCRREEELIQSKSPRGVSLFADGLEKRTTTSRKVSVAHQVVLCLHLKTQKKLN